MTAQSSQKAVLSDERDKLIVALDVATADEALALVKCLGDSVAFYKIGLELVCGGGGLGLAERLVGEGLQVFLDLKLHDIPHTVAGATARIARLGATFLTVHAYPQTMKAARDAAGAGGLRLLAVTVLTSADDADLDAAGYRMGTGDLVARRAVQARDIGIDGLVMSPLEIVRIRQLAGSAMTIVTPGIRPAGGSAGDQKRIMTPGDAIRAGANHLVVGRPITASDDPRAAALAVQAEIAEAI